MRKRVSVDGGDLVVTYRGGRHRIDGAVQAVVDDIDPLDGWVDEYHTDTRSSDMIQTHLLRCAESPGRRRRDGSLYAREQDRIVAAFDLKEMPDQMRTAVRDGLVATGSWVPRPEGPGDRWHLIKREA
ncbi:MAG: hypothetical protein OXF41_20745 [bacterium]|nr:hypothetical protein [bacterium]